MKIEWNEKGLADLMGGIEQKLNADQENYAIPVGSSVEEIEEILTRQLTDKGIEPNPAGIREKAEEIHASWADSPEQ